MTLIKCPSCGQTVLSIASSCPKCSARLSEQRFPLTWEGALTECRRCSRPVPSLAPACPHCGIRRPGRRGVHPMVLAVLVLVVVGVVTARSTISRWSLDSLRRGGGVDSLLVAEAPLNQPSLPPAPASAPRPVVTAPRRPTVAPSRTELPAAGIAGDSGLAGPPPRGTQTMFASTGVHLREGIGDSTAIVAVLRRGDPLVVGAPQDGWSPVYVGGQHAGYVARWLLSLEPPADTSAVTP